MGAQDCRDTKRGQRHHDHVWKDNMDIWRSRDAYEVERFLGGILLLFLLPLLALPFVFLGAVIEWLYHLLWR